jgi:hypothetical protein
MKRELGLNRKFRAAGEREGGLDVNTKSAMQEAPT